MRTSRRAQTAWSAVRSKPWVVEERTRLRLLAAEVGSEAARDALAADDLRTALDAARRWWCWIPTRTPPGNSSWASASGSVITVRPLSHGASRRGYGLISDWLFPLRLLSVRQYVALESPGHALPFDKLRGTAIRLRA